MPTRVPAPGPAAQLRPALTGDIAALSRLEKRAFAGDRISLRSWRSLIGSKSATVSVAFVDGALAGTSVLDHLLRKFEAPHEAAAAAAAAMPLLKTGSC